MIAALNVLTGILLTLVTIAIYHLQTWLEH